MSKLSAYIFRKNLWKRAGHLARKIDNRWSHRTTFCQNFQKCKSQTSDSGIFGTDVPETQGKSDMKESIYFLVPF